MRVRDRSGISYRSRSRGRSRGLLRVLLRLRFQCERRVLAWSGMEDRLTLPPREIATIASRGRRSRSGRTSDLRKMFLRFSTPNGICFIEAGLVLAVSMMGWGKIVRLSFDIGGERQVSSSRGRTHDRIAEGLCGERDRWEDWGCWRCAF